MAAAPLPTETRARLSYHRKATADEAAGTDANVKELRRMKLDGKIDLFTGVISSANTPALGPVAEELAVLTLFTDGCTDFLFDKAVPNPKYCFRMTNI
jgi:branched-chain amino acid transport system substrate-binding protein